MRDDQYTKLKTLQAKLADVLIAEADPDTWSGHGKTPAELTRDERGDRYWCKRNAAATLSVIVRIFSVTGLIERANFPAPGAQPEVPPEAETDLDREVAAAEREARAILKRVAKTSRARTN